MLVMEPGFCILGGARRGGGHAGPALLLGLPYGGEAVVRAVASARVGLGDGPLDILADGGADFAFGGYAVVS